MVTGIMDDKESLHQRRQWVSQYQLQNIQAIESKLCERRKIVLVHGDVVKFIMRHPISTIMSIITLAFMILNLNQGNNLHGYISSNKIHHESHNLRSLEKQTGSGDCIKTPYVTPVEAAYSMPMTPPWYSSGKPSHIALCEELITRNNFVHSDQPQQQEGSLRSSPFTKFTVHESSEFCADWSNPHSALMQIISSSIIGEVGERFGLEYKHNCHKVLDASYHRDLNFDVTTVQEIFPQQKMPIDQNVMALGDIVHDLCVGCIEEHNSNNGMFNGYDSAHHCMALPNRGGVAKAMIAEQVQGPNGMPVMVQREAQVDSEGNVFRTALESVLPLVKNRLWHAARDWQVETKIPRADPTQGVVIYFDAGSSMPIPFHHYKEFIPQYATRVTIMSGPKCAQGELAMSTNQFQSLSCLQYGAELRDYLHDFYQDLAVEVTFLLAASTATAYTRMIQADTLICPPDTKSCLLPALAKDKVKSTVLFETPGSSTINWFSYLGDSVSTVNVMILPIEQMAIDREQQFIEAKYAGFSAEQLIGRKPAGMYRPSPAFITSFREDDTGTINYDATQASSTARGSFTPDINPSEESFVKSESTVAYDAPDVSHLFDGISNHNGASSSDVRSYGEEEEVSYSSSETGRSSSSYSSSSSGPHLPIKQHQYDNVETSVVSYEDQTGSETTVESVEAQPEEDEYELLDTSTSDLDTSSSRNIDLDTSSRSDNAPGETEVNVDHGAVFEEGSGSSSSSSLEETNIARSQGTGTSSDTDLLFSNGEPSSSSSSSSGTGDEEESLSEELMETEVEIDYKNLFHGN